MFHRRQFIKTTAAGIAMTTVTGKLFSCSSSDMSNEKLKEFGLQLYTLRDIISADPKAILKQVADMGYKQIEGYEGDKGIFWGMSNTDFKKYLDDLGIRMVSTHCDINKDFERKADEAAQIGMKYLICPSLNDEAKLDRDGFKKAGELFNQKGKICKDKGLKFAYHNHDQAFTTREGGYVSEEILLQNTDSSLVDFEMDIYWVVTVGQDPISWLKKYPNRFRLCHIKDRKKGALATEREVSVVAGTGSIDFPKILKVAKENGMQYYIVEQEKYENSTPLQAAKANADYLKNLMI